MDNYNSIKLSKKKIININAEMETVTRLFDKYIKEEDTLPQPLKEVDRSLVYKELINLKKSLNLLISQSS